MLIIVALVVLSIYMACPIIGKLVLLVVNTYLPDPIPFVDEFIMWVGLLAHLTRLMSVAECVSEHKVFSCILFILVLLAIVALITHLF